MQIDLAEQPTYTWKKNAPFFSSSQLPNNISYQNVYLCMWNIYRRAWFASKCNVYAATNVARIS